MDYILTNNIRSLRLKNNKSVGQCIRMVGVTRYCWYNYEYQHYQPSLVTAYKIMNYFHVPFNELFNLEAVLK